MGNEIYLIDDIEEYRENYTRETHSYYHFILLAKDEIGFEALKELSSTAWSNFYVQRGAHRVPLEKSELSRIMKKYKGHIMASTACLGGELPQRIMKMAEAEASGAGNIEELKKGIVDFILYCQDVFGEENFFLEVQPSRNEEQIYVNQVIRNLSLQSGAKIIYTTDSHYLSKEDRLVHKAYLDSKDGEREVDAFYATAYMMDKEEVFSYFEDYVPREEFDTWTDNTNIIKNNLEVYDIHQPQIIPEIEVKNFPPREAVGIEREFASVLNMLEEGCKQDRYWVNSCINALKERDLYNKLYLSRINDEAKELLEISKNLGITMSQYYNTMQKIIEVVWDEGNSIVGPARGSATGFLSCYLLDITQVDPIETNLPYWRLT